MCIELALIFLFLFRTAWLWILLHLMQKDIRINLLFLILRFFTLKNFMTQLQRFHFIMALQLFESLFLSCLKQFSLKTFLNRLVPLHHLPQMVSFDFNCRNYFHLLQKVHFAFSSQFLNFLDFYSNLFLIFKYRLTN
jgi:hypothetical protein